MENSDYQDLIEKALEKKTASFEISSKRRALVLSVLDGSVLIEQMDSLWEGGNELLIPLNQKAYPPRPLPLFNINKYSVSPTYRQKRLRSGYHLYDFIYTPK